MEQNHTVHFDASRGIALQLPSPDGVKTVRVRFPTDQEWTERFRRRKVIIKSLGRGVTETTVPNAEDVDAALLAKIRTEEEPAVDPYEAQKLVEQMAQADVDDVLQVGGAYRVTLRVMGATVSHLIGMPSAKDVFEHKRGFARVLELPYGRSELTLNLGVAGAIYKRLAQAAEGYVGEVPIVHQIVAVKAAIDALEAAFQEDQGSSF
jgi:hypothetical protein